MDPQPSRKFLPGCFFQGQPRVSCCQRIYWGQRRDKALVSDCCWFTVNPDGTASKIGCGDLDWDDCDHIKHELVRDEVIIAVPAEHAQNMLTLERSEIMKHTLLIIAVNTLVLAQKPAKGQPQLSIAAKELEKHIPPSPPKPSTIQPASVPVPV